MAKTLRIGPSPLNFEIRQGVTLSFSAVYETDPETGSPAPIDVTGYTAEFLIGRDLNSPDITLTQGAGITLGGAAGTIQVLLTKEQSTTLLAVEHGYVLNIVDTTGSRISLMSGLLNVLDKSQP